MGPAARCHARVVRSLGKWSGGLAQAEVGGSLRVCVAFLISLMWLCMRYCGGSNKHSLHQNNKPPPHTYTPTPTPTPTPKQNTQSGIQEAYEQLIASARHYVYLEAPLLVSGLRGDPLVGNRVAEVIAKKGGRGGGGGATWCGV